MVYRHVVTLSNSIVGVSVLAMPFCFKQCGIVLATVSLMMGAIMTRMVCYFLIKAGVMSRRRTYEMLAWSTFGHTGKFMVEISMIGFLIGTLIAFMVVIGDLGPEILSEIFSVENNSSLRTIIMTALSLFVALPLGLLRNIDSLSSVSTASVLFYLFLLIKIFSEGIGPLWSGEYLERIHFWRSAGVLQCIPIFSMALSCQTQIFGIYDALPEPSVQKMNEIVKKAVNICTFFYFSVGFFGYIAFSQQNFGGNILLTFSSTWTTQLIKSMFLMSVVFSVPLVILPCRASLHSLIFRSSSSAYHHVHDISTNYIPEARMKFLTVTIVGSCLIVGILIPNIELVLGLVGSTTGSVICIIFPSIMFVRVTSKNTTERLLAQIMFFIGVVLMFMTTYATLYAAEQSQVVDKIPEPLKVTEDIMLLKPILNEGDVQLNSPVSSKKEGLILENQPQVHRVEFEHKLPEKMISSKNTGKQYVLPRKESNNLVVETRKEVISEVSKKPVMEDPRPVMKNNDEKPRESLGFSNHVVKQDDMAEKNNVDPKPVVVPKQEAKPVAGNLKSEVKEDHLPVPKTATQDEKVKEAGKEKDEFGGKNVAEDFLKRLEEHQENQKKLLEEQKEILEELKQHHAQDVREKMEKESKSDPASVKRIETVDSPLKAEAAKGMTSANAENMIRQQEQIIAKISENLEKENNNAQLLEKLEENLNKEVKLLDNQAKSNTSSSSSNSVLNKKRTVEENANEVLKSVGNVQQVGNSDVKLNSVVNNHAEVDVPKQNYNKNVAKEDNINNVMQNIDKDKGVLVGSLAGNKPSKSNMDANVQLNKNMGETKVSAGDLDKNFKQDMSSVNNKIDNNVKFSEGGKVKSVAQGGDDDVQNSNLHLEQNGMKKVDELPKIVSSTKKSVSESAPKDKIDREI